MGYYPSMANGGRTHHNVYGRRTRRLLLKTQAVFRFGLDSLVNANSRQYKHNGIPEVKVLQKRVKKIYQPYFSFYRLPEFSVNHFDNRHTSSFQS